ncbi:ribosome small subunit-dependent GTPase A [Lactococcus formosensis]|uniref:ribosome small subunit-dependent GTPase A n=1 Tax=Lactococcus formosensis TaxID=1281486 RepID=UPI00209724F9|nr:ribosome small subunit-dependent GTPase A [Lactococcus formosensis]MCO7180975.1 ribosome small subunit-dependent GTPase A [Lactococcus formosensis]MDG6112189.1 ribosome small subunit-dependent GTPase A [Lactococcus formosensis]MDG6118318.1 ribosome small subunit-dependent GTPase A [Lactococcus formosensis]MDG6139176.1 ribosome small subunit-dependent GTPase A [Lactococcus formosensis]MDG6154178.1 ribosome small subunit-dependent GTPase A [Lactococcus formosensis]
MVKKGRIIKSLAGFYNVESEGQVYQTRARGNFRKKGMKPIVGDFVDFSAEENSEGYILDIHKRKNSLIRPSIANIDQAVIIMSTINPDFSLNLLDRFLVFLEHKDIQPLIYISKLDLLEDTSEYEQFKKKYEAIGYQVFFDWKELTEVLADKVTVFMGQTGAGKTTLLNLIAPGMNLATGETSDKLGRGRHTTRHVEFFEVASGLIADTPGFSNLDYDVSNQPDLNAAFPEILRESHGCKFRECTHTHEPSCAVKEALEEGRILASRYENYLQLLTEINNTRETYAKQRKKQN